MAPTIISAFASAIVRIMRHADGFRQFVARQIGCVLAVRWMDSASAASRTQREISCGLCARDSTIASAVPQLPPPRMAMRFNAHPLRLLFAEGKFWLVALHQSLNIGVVFIDNQQRGGQRAERDHVRRRMMRRPEKINQQAAWPPPRTSMPAKHSASTLRPARKELRDPRNAGGHNARKTPAAVATPLPPRNPSQIGKQCPTSAQRPAIIIQRALSFCKPRGEQPRQAPLSQRRAAE